MNQRRIQCPTTSHRNHSNSVHEQSTGPRPRTSTNTAACFHSCENCSEGGADTLTAMDDLSGDWGDFEAGLGPLNGERPRSSTPHSESSLVIRHGEEDSPKLGSRVDILSARSMDGLSSGAGLRCVSGLLLQQQRRVYFRYIASNSNSPFIDTGARHVIDNYRGLIAGPAKKTTSAKAPSRVPLSSTRSRTASTTSRTSLDTRCHGESREL